MSSGSSDGSGQRLLISFRSLTAAEVEGGGYASRPGGGGERRMEGGIRRHQRRGEAPLRCDQLLPPSGKIKSSAREEKRGRS